MIGAPGPKSKIAWLTLLALGIGYSILRMECLQSEALGRECLSSMALFFAAIVSLGDPIRQNPFTWYFCAHGSLFCLTLLIAIVVCLKSKGSRLSRAVYFSAILLGITADFLATRSLPFETLSCYAGVALLAAVACYFGRPSGQQLTAQEGNSVHEQKRSTSLLWGEGIIVVLLFTLILINRFYSLNRLIGGWDQETCPHRLIAESWEMMLQQATGQHVQQSAGFSWVALHRLFTRLIDPYYFLLDERLLGVAISLIGCWSVYFLVRRIAGSFAAFIALSLYAFGPMDLPWSRQPTLHHLPIVITVFMVWLTILAVNEKRWRYFILLALLMPITQFIYPSGRMMFLVPSIAIFSHMLFWRAEWRGHKRQALLIVAGIALWFSIVSLINLYVYGEWRWISVIGTRNVMSSETGIQLDIIVNHMRTQFGDFIYSILYRQVSPTHWEIPAVFEPKRAISSLVSIFSLIGTVRLLANIKSIYSLTMLAAILSGLVPGLLSEMADRRAGATLMILGIVAAIEFSTLLALIREKLRTIGARIFLGISTISIICGFLFMQVTSYFSQTKYRATQLLIADVIRPEIEDDTLLVYFGDWQCDILMNIYDLMIKSKGRIALSIPIGYDSEGFEEQARNAIVVPKPNVKTWYYVTTPLVDQIPFLEKKEKWRKVVFVVHFEGERGLKILQILKEIYPNAQSNYIDLKQTQLTILVKKF